MYTVKGCFYYVELVVLIDKQKTKKLRLKGLSSKPLSTGLPTVMPSPMRMYIQNLG